MLASRMLSLGGYPNVNTRPCSKGYRCTHSSHAANLCPINERLIVGVAMIPCTLIHEGHEVL